MKAKLRYLGLEVHKLTITIAVAEEGDNDPVAMAERIQAEVWDKVDYATYGTAM